MEGAADERARRFLSEVVEDFKAAAREAVRQEVKAALEGATARDVVRQEVNAALEGWGGPRASDVPPLAPPAEPEDVIRRPDGVFTKSHEQVQKEAKLSNQEWDAIVRAAAVALACHGMMENGLSLKKQVKQTVTMAINHVACMDSLRHLQLAARYEDAWPIKVAMSKILKSNRASLIRKRVDESTGGPPEGPQTVTTPKPDSPSPESENNGDFDDIDEDDPSIFYLYLPIAEARVYFGSEKAAKTNGKFHPTSTFVAKAEVEPIDALLHGHKPQATECIVRVLKVRETPITAIEKVMVPLGHRYPPMVRDEVCGPLLKRFREGIRRFLWPKSMVYKRSLPNSTELVEVPDWKVAQCIPHTTGRKRRAGE